MNTALKITSCLSVMLALFLLYTLIDELQGNLSVLEISFFSLLISVTVFANAVLAVLILAGKKKPRQEFLILQLFYHLTDRLTAVPDSVQFYNF